MQCNGFSALRMEEQKKKMNAVSYYINEMMLLSTPGHMVASFLLIVLISATRFMRLLFI